MPYDMPKFSAIPPGPDTTGDWDEMAYPAGEGVTRIHDIRPASQIIADMMTEAHALLSAREETTKSGMPTASQ
jgi:enoyl-[acyl-carrier protein] reductase II